MEMKSKFVNLSHIHKRCCPTESGETPSIRKCIGDFLYDIFGGKEVGLMGRERDFYLFYDQHVLQHNNNVLSKMKLGICHRLARSLLANQEASYDSHPWFHISVSQPTVFS